MLAGADNSFVFLLIPVFLAVAVFGFFFKRSRSESIIEQWARENGFEVLEANRAYLTTAFMFRKGRDQTVYRVRVRDASGQERSGYVRCGGFWGGVTWSDKATVEWDD